MSTLFEILHPNVVSEENEELVRKYYDGKIVNAPEGLGLKLETAKDWYGIPGIKFIFWNTQSDPGIVYKDHYINSFVVEDSMWSLFNEFKEDEELGDEFEDKEFADFMRENVDRVYEFCDLAIGIEI